MSDATPSAAAPNDIDQLREVPLFSKMDDQEIAELRAMMAVNSFAPGQVIFREGEPGDHFHIVTEGHVQFLTQDATGHELVLDDTGPGGFFGELSMLTGEPRSARVRAVDRVRTLSLEREHFLNFLRTHPHASIDVLSVLGRRLYRSDQLLRQSVSKNVNQIVQERQTFGQRLADGFAALMGSWTFILVQSVICALWLIYNPVAEKLGWYHWDPYPFTFLNLVLGFLAAYAAPIIMMSQNRAADKDRLAVEIDHKVNLKAEVEIGLILRRLDDLERSMHFNHQEQCRLLRTPDGNDASKN
jgi:uncharacterized membrane protein